MTIVGGDQISRPRVVIITQGISRIVNPILNQTIVEVVGICESAPRNFVKSDSDKPTLKKYVKQMLAVSRKNDALKNKSTSAGISYFLLHKENLAAFRDWLDALKPDLVVIYSMSQLLPHEILGISRLGVLNLHPSLLPAYRGPNPWFWMYFNCEKHGGVTLHYVDAGEDTGDVIFQRIYEIPLGMKSPEMQDLAIGKHGVEIILEAFKQISQGTELPRLKQPAQSVTARARNIKPEEHRSLVCWETWPIERIWHLMRGTESWLNCTDMPAGFCTGGRWLVQEFSKQSAIIDPSDLGQVKNDDQGFYVQCRDGIIRLEVKFSPWVFVRSILKRWSN